MANCPQCGRKLKLTDYKPECPGCGVNLNYYKANEKLMADSEKAEIEHAHFQPKIDRAKASFVGTKLNIARIVLTVLPVGALFLPLAKIDGKGVNVINVYNFISSADIGALLGSVTKGNLFPVSLVTLLLAAVMFLITLILILMALGKHAKIRNTTLNSVQLALAVISIITFAVGGNGISDFLPDVKSTSVGIGAVLFAVLILAELILTIIIYKKGTPVNYTVCRIGGIPSDEYFEYVNSGMSRDELNRKMLIYLTELEEQSNKKEENGNE